MCVCGHMHCMKFKIWIYMFKVILFRAVSIVCYGNCQINQKLVVFMIILGNVNLFILFLISNFCRVLNVLCFLLGNSLPSEFYMPTFQNTPSVPSS
jgi:hypothetical protein